MYIRHRVSGYILIHLPTMYTAYCTYARVGYRAMCWNRCVSEDYRFNDSARILMLHIIYYYTYALSPCQIFKTIHIHKYVRIVLLLYVLCITYHVVLFLWHFFFQLRCKLSTLHRYYLPNGELFTHYRARRWPDSFLLLFRSPIGTNKSSTEYIRTRVDEGRQGSTSGHNLRYIII